MASAVAKKRSSTATKGHRREAEEEQDDAPSLQDRAQSGLKLAGHVEKAAKGGKMRKAYALWSASRQLPVVAAGAGEQIKRHPGLSAVVGGVAAAGLIYILAARAAAADASADEAEDSDESSESDEDDDAEAEGSAAEDEADDEEEDDEGDEEPEEDE